MLDQQLIDYVKEQLRLGTSRDYIRNSLLSNGWQEIVINEALNIATGAAAPMPPVPPAPIQSLSQPGAASNNPKSFQLYAGKAPWPVQLVGGLMWLSGIGSFLMGIPLLLFYGLGVLYIALGIFMVKYGSGLFKMQKKAYKGAIILSALSILSSIVGALIPSQNISLLSPEAWSQIAGAVLFIVILRAYREKFVN